MAKTRKLSPALKAWTAHWKKVRAEMEKKGTFKKGEPLMKVFKEAKKSFKKHKGGEDPEPNEVNATNVPDNVPETNATGGRGRKTRRRGGRKH
jgi:hypothetical protein